MNAIPTMRGLMQIVEEVIRLFDPSCGMVYMVEKNPSRRRYDVILARSETTDFKGIVTDRDFYVWPAVFAHHGQIAMLLGLEQGWIAVTIGGGIWPGSRDYADTVRANPHIQYLRAKVDNLTEDRNILWRLSQTD